MYDENYMSVTERAREVADDLLGTCEDLRKHATGEEIDDREFCMELDSIVMCCDQCGWWVEAHEINDDGECEECAPSSKPSQG